jgi:hypothetical protein
MDQFWAHPFSTCAEATHSNYIPFVDDVKMKLNFRKTSLLL